MRNHESRTVRQGGIGLTMVVPFTAVDEWTVVPDGTVVIARGSPYRVGVRSSTGSVTTGPERTTVLPAVTKADREQAARDRARNAQRSGLAGLSVPEMPDDVYPATKASLFGAVTRGVWRPRRGDSAVDDTRANHHQAGRTR